ncbi:hypothetical protein, partial [Thermoflexus hugenholtzii]
MAWTVEDLRDLAELLRAHPEWREPLWALLASEEVRRMPERMERGFRRAARLILALYRAQRRTEESLRRLAETFAAHRQEFLAHREETDRRFAELSAEVRALAEAQRRHYEEFVAHRAETDRRFAELAEAQRRTEESLAAHRAETDRRFAELSAEVRALAEAQRRTEEILQQVLLRQEQFQRTLDHFGQIIGPITEEHMVQALQEWIAQQGGALLTPVVSMTLDGLGEVDGLARARLPDGREAWLLVSAKAKGWARSITEFVERILQQPEARKRLQAQGVGDPVLPVVFGRALDHRALEA